jgi:4a-hydroxytetrahydrobiopterin dehydratase
MLTPFDVRTSATVPGGRHMLHFMGKVDKAEAERRLAELPGWGLEGDAIRRQFTFAGFPEAIAYVVRLGYAAEAVDHHPDILINYKRVTLTYTTHSAGGLTDKDFAGAAEATRLAGE